MRYKIKAYSIFEKGYFRETQEDSIFPASNEVSYSDRLFMVCDGMGGHEAGEVASQTVCEVMSRVILQESPGEEILKEDVILHALEEAYDTLDLRDPNPESTKKMGTTMTLLKLHREGATIAHIGDSRVYQFRKNEDDSYQIIHRTSDHSLVNDLLKVGEITPEEAETFPRKNVITRAMQSHQERRSRPDVSFIKNIQPDDYFFLCSDGMLENTSDKNLCFMIGKKDTSDEEKINMLKATSEDNRDNHSAYLVHVIDISDNTVANNLTDNNAAEMSAAVNEMRPKVLGTVVEFDDEAVAQDEGKMASANEEVSTITKEENGISDSNKDKKLPAPNIDDDKDKDVKRKSFLRCMSAIISFISILFILCCLGWYQAFRNTHPHNIPADSSEINNQDQDIEASHAHGALSTTSLRKTNGKPEKTETAINDSMHEETDSIDSLPTSATSLNDNIITNNPVPEISDLSESVSLDSVSAAAENNIHDSAEVSSDETTLLSGIKKMFKVFVRHP